MKYNISINQKAVVDAGLIGKLDFVDLCLFDFIYGFFNSAKADKSTMTEDGVVYYNIQLGLIKQQMPLLDIGTKRTFINRMNKLIDAELIERYPHNQIRGLSYFKRGVKFSIMEFSEPVKQNNNGMKTDSQGCETDCVDPTKIDSHNNSNNIDNNNKKDNDKSLSQKEDEECTPLPQAKSTIDFEAIKQCWAETNPNLAQPRIINDKRKTAIKTLLSSCKATIEDVEKVFKIIAVSDHCNGRSKGSNGWLATFDWVIGNTNNCFTRLLEGGYLIYSAYEQDAYNKIMAGDVKTSETETRRNSEYQ